MKKQIENVVTYAISLKSDHTQFDKGSLYNTIQLFSSEYNISHCCVGQTGNHVFAYLRFKKPTSIDIVRSLCVTAFQGLGSSAVIKLLHSRCRRRNWLQMIYTNDQYLLETLSTEDKFLLPFEILLPVWLAQHDGVTPKLDDPFLMKNAACYDYITARLRNRTIRCGD